MDTPIASIFPVSHCPIVPVSWCPSVFPSQCPYVPVLWCPSVPLSWCPGVPVSQLQGRGANEKHKKYSNLRKTGSYRGGAHLKSTEFLYMAPGWYFPGEHTNFICRKFSKSQEILRNMNQILKVLHEYCV